MYLSDDIVDVPVVVVAPEVVLCLLGLGLGRRQLRDDLHPLLRRRRPPTRQLLPAQVPRRATLKQLLPGIKGMRGWWRFGDFTLLPGWKNLGKILQANDFRIVY